MRHSQKFAVAIAITIASIASISPARAAAQMSHMPPGVTAATLSNGTKALTDAKGMTLYTYARDTIPGKSVCNGRCLQNWPALKAESDAMSMGDWSIVTRDDASKMWAYKGKPLYTFVRDTTAGMFAGDGAANGAWKIAVP